MRRFTRRTRHRRTLWLTAAALAATLALILGIAVFSPILALRTITIQGNARVSTEQLTAALDGQLGTPLALVDFDRITRELAEFSLIRSYVTETVPPDTLIIHIIERQPVGAIKSGSVYRVVDPAGVEISRSPDRAPGVPVIDIAGASIDSAAFSSVVEVMLALPPDLAAQVETISARTKDDVTVSLAGANQTVVWGSADRSDYKARVLAAMLPLYAGSGPGQYVVSSPDTAVFRRN